MSEVLQVEHWVEPLAIVVSFAVFGRLIQSVLLRYLKAVFARTETKLDDILFDSVIDWMWFWFMLAGVSVAIPFFPLNPHWHGVLSKATLILSVFSATLAASQFVSKAVEAYSNRLRVVAATSSLTANLARAVVIAFGTLILLSNLGISITPLLTALGVGSLAVALALQDTLANLFAGIYIIASHVVEIGAYIKLDGGPEGFVDDVGWRMTKLREPSNNHVLIPNSKLSQSIITNYQWPQPEVSIAVPMGVAYGTDLERVERVTLEVARQVQQKALGAVPGFEPAVRFHTFADSSINFNVVLRAKSFPDRSLLIHDFMKAVHARFVEEGLDIPFPQRVVHLQNKTS